MLYFDPINGGFPLIFLYLNPTDITGLSLPKSVI